MSRTPSPSRPCDNLEIAVVFGTTDPATGRLQLQVFPCVLLQEEDLEGLEMGVSEIDDNYQPRTQADDT